MSDGKSPKSWTLGDCSFLAHGGPQKYLLNIWWDPVYPQAPFEFPSNLRSTNWDPAIFIKGNYRAIWFVKGKNFPRAPGLSLLCQASGSPGSSVAAGRWWWGGWIHLWLQLIFQREGQLPGDRESMNRSLCKRDESELETQTLLGVVVSFFKINNSKEDRPGWEAGSYNS